MRLFSVNLYGQQPVILKGTSAQRPTPYSEPLFSLTRRLSWLSSAVLVQLNQPRLDPYISINAMLALEYDYVTAYVLSLLHPHPDRALLPKQRAPAECRLDSSHSCRG